MFVIVTVVTVVAVVPAVPVVIIIIGGGGREGDREGIRQKEKIRGLSA